MLHRCSHIVLILGVISATELRAEDQATSRANAAFFEQRIRPLLVEHCTECHGDKKQEGGLRLDTRAGWLKGGDSGPAVVPGKPADSELLAAVRQTGDLKMPPAPRPKLTDEDIARLEQWIAADLPWPETSSPAAPDPDQFRRHWAFQPIVAPPVPAVANAHWPNTDMDRFVLARLESAGLAPAPPADRRTLLRRACGNLTGLPPTIAQQEEFENDPRPTRDAFAALVDRLLATPQYGERWARHWLDIARYADNKGYVFFEEQSYPWAYAYRDWVIRALNEDLPYDQFILQQLAADQLPLGADQRPLAALGFITVGGHFMNNVHDIFDDRIDVVSRGLLGLTVGCARCHDHKYDPIPQSDYYALYGVFRSSSEPLVPPLFEKTPENEGYEYFELELSARRLRLNQFLDRKHAELVASGRERVAEYLLAAYASRDQPSTEDFMLLIPEGDLHPMVVQRYWLYLQRTRKTHDPVWAPWHALTAIPADSFATEAPRVLSELLQSRDPARPLNPLVVQVLQGRTLQSMADVAACYGELLKTVDQQWRQQASQSGTGSPDALTDPAAEQLRQVFYAPDAPANVPRVAGWGVLTLLPDRAAQAEFQKLIKDLESWLIHGPQAPPRAMAVVDDAEPYNPRIFLRGNPNRAGANVPRRFLEFLSPNAGPFQQGSGRLELARAIANPKNPLTARVLVNRVWQQHFGTGLVRTPSDFGLRGEPPTHPELLDYLAARFMAEGWSIKQLQRWIMHSAVYQQSSSGGAVATAGTTAEPAPSRADTLDPENRLLSHMPRRRLDFEALRDALLSVAGVLDPTVGGPSVNLLAGNRRRSVYGFIDRLALPGLLRTFDFPSPDTSSATRDQTTVAPQALYLLNGPFAADCARQVLARPELAAEQDIGRKTQRLHRLLLARAATADDMRLAEEFLAAAGADRQADVAWQRYVHALLLTNEFVFID